jgi:hypothetical protein
MFSIPFSLLMIYTSLVFEQDTKNQMQPIFNIAIDWQKDDRALHRILTD